MADAAELVALPPAYPALTILATSRVVRLPRGQGDRAAAPTLAAAEAML